MGEQPIFSTKAHVFHIDPKTKRSWIPASSSAISVSFFFDSTRNLYRIISVEGTKAVINSTITPNMTFTKTSQKFGQWSDIRANTVYGLGFASEPELNKFIEKFQEVKEATRQAAQQKAQTNGSASTPVTSGSASPSSSRSQSQQSQHGHASPASLPGGGGGGGGDTPCGPGDQQLNHGGPQHHVTQQQLEQLSLSATLPGPHNEMVNSLKSPLVAHQRSQSLSGLQKGSESPKHQAKDKSAASLPQSTTEAQLRYENDRLKLALAQSSANAKKWEVELQTLKTNNVRLTSALQESTSNVEEWKRQLQALKEENIKMKSRTLELEASHGNPEAIAELRKEIGNLRNRAETLEAETKQKDKELDMYRKRLDDHQHIHSTSQKVEDKLKLLLSENDNLKSTASRLQEQMENSKAVQRAKKAALEQLNARLALKIQEMRDIQQEVNVLLNS